MKIRIGRRMVLLAALAAASAPLTSQAVENPALDRCVEMFVKEVVPADRAVEIREDEIQASIRTVNKRRSTVWLVARGEKHAQVLGRASCTIDRNGTLIAMYMYDSTPMVPSRPKVLARNLDATSGARTAFADETKPF